MWKEPGWKTAVQIIAGGAIWIALIEFLPVEYGAVVAFLGFFILGWLFREGMDGWLVQRRRRKWLHEVGRRRRPVD